MLGETRAGLLVLLCAEPHDPEAQAAKLLDKLLKLRLISDAVGNMNRSVQDLDGTGTPGSPRLNNRR